MRSTAGGGRRPRLADFRRARVWAGTCRRLQAKMPGRGRRHHRGSPPRIAIAGANATAGIVPERDLLSLIHCKIPDLARDAQLICQQQQAAGRITVGGCVDQRVLMRILGYARSGRETCALPRISSRALTSRVCDPGRSAVMITAHVPCGSCSSDHTGCRVAAAVTARAGVEDRGDPDAAPSARRPAAAVPRPTEAELGGPGPARRPARRDTEGTPRRPASGDPDTVLRWHRDIVRRRRPPDPCAARPGRPATRRSIRTLIRRLAARTPGGGTAGSMVNLAGLGVKVAASTVWEILRSSGIEPARLAHRAGLVTIPALPGPTPSWHCDFFTADLLDGTQAYVLASSSTPPGASAFLGVTLHQPGNGQPSRPANLIMDIGGQAHRVKFMIATAAPTSPARSTPSSPTPGSGPCCATSKRPG